MPQHYAAYGRHGNYRGQPYGRMRMVCFLSSVGEREAWLNALPNKKGTLINRKDLYVCAFHFNCDWQICTGGKRPAGPPTVFADIPNSCLKQTIAKPRKP